MIALTDNASAIVNQILAQHDMGEDAGLRISTDDAPTPNFELAAAPQAEPGDQVVDKEGAPLYLDASAAQLLDDKILDASVDESGNVEFSLVQQS